VGNCGQTTSKKWIDCTVKTAWEAIQRGLTCSLKDPTSKGERLTIVHLGSHKGFVPGGLYMFQSSKSNDYHADMNAEVFETWLTSVLPELDADSVIILDNAPYHSRRKQKIPNTSWKKEDIVQWLCAEGVPVDTSFLKTELLNHVHNLHVQPTYVVDELIRNSGRRVLRTPPYHCALNPIEMIWANLKGCVSTKNRTFKLADMKLLLAEGIALVTEENWRDCINHVVHVVEEEMWKLDDLIEKEMNIEPVIITFSDSESDSW